MSKSKNLTINKKDNNVIPCVLCNPKKYLKFNFSFINYESSNVKDQDAVKFLERMRWLSNRPYTEMIFEYGRDKNKWFESLPLNSVRKTIPSNFREFFPVETNEHYDVLRIYSAGVPNGTANPRIIGMIKNTIFYVFFLDWDGKLYNHGR